MTGSVQEKEMRSGKIYLYIILSYKDPKTQKWKTKSINTKLTKGNKKKAEAMIPDTIERYEYLEASQIDDKADIDYEIKFCDYLDKWLEQKKNEVEISTYEGYVYRTVAIKRYFEQSGLKVRDITSRHIDKFVKYELKFGKLNKKTGERGPLAVRTVRERKSILSSIFNQACIDGLVKYNVVAPVKVTGKKNSDFEEDMLFLTEDEVTELLTFLSEEYPRLMPIAFVAAYFGLRRSELLGLRWYIVDFEARTITIKNTVVKVKKIHEKEKTKTKNSRRTLHLFKNAEKCFLHVKKEQEEFKEFFGSEYKATKDYIFTKEDGSCYDPDWLSKAFSKATAEFGRPEITLHNLRHSCASMAINRGWDVKQLQYWLGHSDIQTTLNIYAHYNKQRLNKTDNDLNEMSQEAGELF